MTHELPAAPPRPKRRRPIFIMTAVLFGLFLALLAVRNFKSLRPEALARAVSEPVSIVQRAGAWFWLEHPSGPNARLLRAANSRVTTLAAADALPEYDTDGKDAAWIERKGREWQIVVAPCATGVGRILWSGAEQPRGICLSGERVYWLRLLPAAAPDSGVLPPLAPTTSILSVSRTGGAPTTVGHLPESDGGRALGMHEGALYVSAYRREAPGSTVVYRLPSDGGPPRRIMGEFGIQPTLLTRDGALYWLAPSREATVEANACCIRRLGRAGRPENLSDWLPAGGSLVETMRGIRYVDAGYPVALWPEGRFDQLPRSFSLPKGYALLAAGDNEVLLRAAAPSSAGTLLYRAPLP